MQTEPFHPLNATRNVYLESTSIHIAQCSSCFLHLVRTNVSRFGAYLTIARASLRKHWFQGSDLLLKSRYVPYGT